MPKRAATTADRHVAVQDVGATLTAPLAPASKKVSDAIEAGVISLQMLFPENGPPRTVETWRPPVIQDRAVGEAIWSRLTELDEWLTPAPRAELMSRILVLLAHYRLTAHVNAVEQGIADDWAEDLANYPMWAIDKAAKTWRRTKKFRPQIGEIIELCEEEVGRISVERQRLQSIVDATARAAKPLAEKTRALANEMFKTPV